MAIPGTSTGASCYFIQVLISNSSQNQVPEIYVPVPILTVSCSNFNRMAWFLIISLSVITTKVTYAINIIIVCFKNILSISTKSGKQLL